MVYVFHTNKDLHFIIFITLNFSHNLINIFDNVLPKNEELQNFTCVERVNHNFKDVRVCLTSSKYNFIVMVTHSYVFSYIVFVDISIMIDVIIS